MNPVHKKKASTPFLSASMAFGERSKVKKLSLSGEVVKGATSLFAGSSDSWVAAETGDSGFTDAWANGEDDWLLFKASSTLGGSVPERMSSSALLASEAGLVFR